MSDQTSDVPPTEDVASADRATMESQGDVLTDDAGAQDAAGGPVGQVAASAGSEERLKQLENEGDIAADYLEELLDIADLDGDLDMDVEGDRASVSIVGGDLDRLIGRNGEVLDALQELTRLAVLRETGERSRLMLDIGGHRAERRAVLEGLARDAVASVQESGQPVSLKPMTPFERKVIHDVVAASGLVSDSEGVEPKRYVVVRPS
jgi:spoIIIJ-associated protein